MLLIQYDARKASQFPSWTCLHGQSHRNPFSRIRCIFRKEPLGIWCSAWQQSLRVWSVGGGDGKSTRVTLRQERRRALWNPGGVA